MSETKKLRVVRGNEQHPELVIKWLKEEGATDYNDYEGFWDAYYYFVTPSNEVDVLDIDSPILKYIDYEVVELAEPQFKPFDKVLVRMDDKETWQINHFSHIRSTIEHRFVCEFGTWAQCITYEGNEYLVGTKDSPAKKGGKQ